MFFGNIPRGTQLDLALWWAGRGVPVFPCYPKTKRPCTKNGFKDASIDEDQIRWWWRELPHALVAAPTGEASGFDVVDADKPKKGETLTPEEALEGFRSQYDAANTPTCGTMSGGFHQYFKHRPGVKSSQRKYAPQIDTRGQGGFVVLAGNPGYAVVHDCELADFPQLPNGKANGHIDLNQARVAPELTAMLAEAHKPGAWWGAMVRATAHLHTRGTPHDVILDLLAAPATLEGYTIEQTRAELAKMLRGATEKVERGEWRRPNGPNGNAKIILPDRGSKGAPLNSYANARAVLSGCGEFAFSYERFADRAYFNLGEQLTDEAVSAMRQMIVAHYQFDPGLELTYQAARQLAWENSMDRVCAWLDSLEWDGVERLNSWLSDYAGAVEGALNSAFGRKTLIASVRRARHPGCKFDYVLTLQGAQGVGKSSVPRILAGEAALFSDQEILSLKAREQQEAMAGIWFYELSEMAGYKKTDIERVKAFVSRTHDRARPVWGRVMADQPRRCVFIATTNDSEPFHDPTGSRRFWPVDVEIINLEALERDRRQLFAEAAFAEASGEPLTLPPELWGEAAAAQEARTEQHPWALHLASLKGRMILHEEGSQARLAWSEIWGALGIPAERQSPQGRRTVTQILEKMGWSKSSVTMKIEGEVVRGFVRELK